VRDGRALCAPVTEGLRCYPVRVEGARVLLNLAR
jgi:naphthalene 1,2-dioxygenase system ferredoxin subunit